jgi:hypothetical protein
MRDLSKNMDNCRQCGPVAFNLNPSQSNFSTSASSANEGSGLRPKRDTSSASLLDADCNDDVSVDQQSVSSNTFAGAQARIHGWNYTRMTPVFHQRTGNNPRPANEIASVSLNQPLNALSAVEEARLRIESARQYMKSRNP